MLKIFCYTVTILVVAQLFQKTAANYDNFGQFNIRRLAAERLQGFDQLNQHHITRRIQSKNNGKWRKLNIFFDLTKLHKQNPTKRAYYEKVFWITKQWWEQTVWINDSKSEQNRFYKKAIRQGLIKKFKYPKGESYKDYDLLINVHMAPSDGGTLAWAGPAYRHPVTQRPISGECGVTWFGDKNFASQMDSINAAAGTIIHEFGHVVAFISFQDFHKHYTHYDNHLKSWKWTGHIAMLEAQKYYGCSKSKMTGIRLQTMSRKTAGAHWSEALLQDELLTPEAGAEPEKVSPMTIGLLEDTHWYKANYSMVENYTYKKGVQAHCSMVQTCPQRTSCRKGSSGFVTWDYRAIGYCDKDPMTGCYTEQKYGNRNVAIPGKWPKLIKKYGATFGVDSVIAKGTFIRFNSSMTSYKKYADIPVKATCDKSHNMYTYTFAKFNFNTNTQRYKGDKKITCKKAGQIKKFNCYSGICSQVVCYDPKVLCSTINKRIGDLGQGFKQCDASCKGNGRCQPGFPDLAKKVKTANDHRRLFTSRAHMNKIVSHYPKNAKNTRKIANNNPGQSKGKKDDHMTYDKIMSWDGQKLNSFIKRRSKTKECSGMSKSKKCGKGFGFCRWGYCNKLTNTCGEFANYHDNQIKEYSYRPYCKRLVRAKKVKKIRARKSAFLKKTTLDDSSHGFFKNMFNNMKDDDGMFDDDFNKGDDDEEDSELENEWLKEFDHHKHKHKKNAPAQTPRVKPAPVVTKPQTPAVAPKPVVQPKAPVVQPQAPVAQPQTPIAKPQAPVAQPQAPIAQPQAPVVQPKPVVKKPKVPNFKTKKTNIKNPNKIPYFRHTRSKNINHLPKADQIMKKNEAATGTWKCWCYQNAKVALKCPNFKVAFGKKAYKRTHRSRKYHKRRHH